MSEKISLEERVARARAAQKQFEFATQEQADAACRAVLKVVFDNAEKFGPMAAEESRMGSREDKIAKCRNKSALIWNDLKDKKSCGIIRRIPEKKMLEIAKPMGVVASIIPSTNPVVTPMSNGAYALKTRNAIIFSPHPRAVECTNLLVGLFRDELKKLGLPEDLIQVVDEVSIEASAELMAACDLVVATGGNDMVKSAYSSGKPAIGVGQGNVQTIIDENADIAKAVGDIIIGRSFDNGLICLGEQCVHVPESKLNEIVTEFKKQGAYIVEDAEEKDKLREVCFPGGGAFSRFCVGNTAPEVAEQAGIADVPAGTRVLAAVVDGVGAADVLCREKLCPVMVSYRIRLSKKVSQIWWQISNTKERATLSGYIPQMMLTSSMRQFSAVFAELSLISLPARPAEVLRQTDLRRRQHWAAVLGGITALPVT